MRTSFAIVAALSLAAAAVACGDDDEGGGGGNNSTAQDPVPGSGAADAAPTPGAEIPALNLNPGTNPPPPADAGSTVPNFDVDAGPPNVAPPEPVKRKIWFIDDNRHLVRVLAEDPQNTVVDITIVGLGADAVNDHILGMDFRPATGALYVLTTAAKIYMVDLVTATGTQVGTAPAPAAVIGQAHGFDFNPVADKIRIHTDVDQNLRLDPVTGAVAGTDATLAFAETDVNFLQSPNLIGTAYTNSVAPTPATTELYAIDSTRNLLTKVANPNDGKVTTVGPLGVDIIEMAGFDIWGSAGTLEAYATARVEGGTDTGLYKIDLTTGAATLVGPIKHPSRIRAMAIQP
jgi:hypothetical protein